MGSPGTSAFANAAAGTAAALRRSWPGLASGSVRAFHAYGNWLVGLTWARFVLASVLLIAGANVLSDLPPFAWTFSETVEAIEGQPATPVKPPAAPRPPAPPKAAAPPAAAPAPSAPASAASSPGKSKRPLIHIEKTGPGKTSSVEISIDENGVRIKPKRAEPAASAASSATDGVVAEKADVAAAGAAARQAADAVVQAQSKAQAEAAAHVQRVANELAKLQAVANSMPEGPAREAVERARDEVEEVVRAAQEEARALAEEARQAAEEARDAAAQAARAMPAAKAGKHQRTTQVRLGDFLPNLAVFWVLASAVMKVTYRRQIQAEAEAAQAVETAEAESLKRQVVEARMAAMQAQVEPHFLFNTLASIDHLIEVDPARASQMQKNLIALLRASMPSLREASDGGVRDLGRELAVIRPYLEILKVRMEERLVTELQVPDGLLSAEFPPMMMQTLVENAIKHGLEPKPEGGRLRIAAEIVHGKLAVTVADTGLGFGRAATAGTGVGLANIRERLALLFGHKASLTITETPGGGTTVTIAVPYRPVQAAEGVAG